MREILFRGKRVDNGNWENGSVVFLRKGTSEEKAFIADKMTAYHTPVVSDSIGQYTGLTDKNGTKIFEGDIVQYELHDIRNRAVIKYGAPKEDSFCYGWYLDDNNGNTSFLFCKNFIKGYNCQVIGNIHDNSYLLK